jgi:hypothetical protein
LQVSYFVVDVIIQLWLIHNENKEIIKRTLKVARKLFEMMTLSLLIFCGKKVDYRFT